MDATRGRILTYGGAPIDAFFYSTCGGRTADGTEVFRGADRPYLRSVSDAADDGTAYCSLSPRFRWHEEWSGRGAARDAAAHAARAPGRRRVDGGGVGPERDPGRAGVLPDPLGARRPARRRAPSRRRARWTDPNVRQVLRPPSGELLRSNTFTLTVTGTADGSPGWSADGAGAGHGVGFCQWGAVGRSRAGQDYEHILAAYYPGAVLERLY